MACWHGKKKGPECLQEQDDGSTWEQQANDVLSGTVCNVCSRGGDREAVIRDIDIDRTRSMCKNQIHVHYVGSEDEDEWVPCEPQRVQLAPMPEKELSQLEHAKAQEVQSSLPCAASRPLLHACC